jgi:hypothetical protein
VGHATMPLVQRDLMTTKQWVLRTAPGRLLGRLAFCVPARIGPAILKIPLNRTQGLPYLQWKHTLMTDRLGRVIG